MPEFKFTYVGGNERWDLAALAMSSIAAIVAVFFLARDNSTRLAFLVFLLVIAGVFAAKILNKAKTEFVLDEEWFAIRSPLRVVRLRWNDISEVKVYKSSLGSGSDTDFRPFRELQVRTRHGITRRIKVSGNLQDASLEGQPGQGLTQLGAAIEAHLGRPIVEGVGIPKPDRVRAIVLVSLMVGVLLAVMLYLVLQGMS